MLDHRVVFRPMTLFGLSGGLALTGGCVASAATSNTTSTSTATASGSSGGASGATSSGVLGNPRVLDWGGLKGAVSFTLDDAQPSQVDHWPELKATGARMTFYLNTSGSSYAGFDATWKDAVAQGCELGNHTVNHCHADPTGCSNYLGSLDQEIDQCSAYITTRLGPSAVWTFAFPYGDVGWESYAQSRFFVARGVGGGTIAANDDTDPFNLPIYAAAGGEAASVFSGQIDAAVAQGRWVILLFHSILPTSQNWYAGVDITSITGSIDHAKTLGNVWIDTVANIGAYWRAQKIFSSLTPTTSGTSKVWTWTLPAHFPPGQRLRVVIDGGAGTLTQGAGVVPLNDHGYYEIALDAGTLTLSP